MAKSPVTPLSLRLLLTAFVAGWLAAILIVLVMATFGGYTKTRGRFLLSALSLSGASLIALYPSILDRKLQKEFLQSSFTAKLSLLTAWAGALSVIIGFTLIIAGIWATPNSDAYWKATAIASLLAVFLAQACWILLLEPYQGWARLASRLALGSALLVALLVPLAIILEIKSTPFWWAMTLLILLETLLSIALPVLNRMSRNW